AAADVIDKREAAVKSDPHRVFAVCSAKHDYLFREAPLYLVSKSETGNVLLEHRSESDDVVPLPRYPRHAGLEKRSRARRDALQLPDLLRIQVGSGVIVVLFIGG